MASKTTINHKSTIGDIGVGSDSVQIFKCALIIAGIDFYWWMEIFCMLFQHTFRHYVGLHDDILAKKIEVDGVIEMCW